MKKFIVLFLLVFSASLLFAQTTIYAKDGRTFNLPVNANEILRIEFSSTPGTVVPDPGTLPQEGNAYAGKWFRKEGGTIAEYMEIKQSSNGEFDIIFKGPDNGKITFKGIGTIQKGDIKSKFTEGSKRKFTLHMNDSKQIEYTSTELDGSKPWSCVWTRSN